MGSVRVLLAAAALAAAAGAFAQQPTYAIAVPAAPGTEWDRAARTLGEAMVTVRAASGFTVDNRADAGGIAGLAHFVKSTRGDSSALLFGGQALVAAVELDRAAPRMHEASPLARLAVSHYVVFVPAASPFRTMADLARAFKADPASIAWNVGAAGSPEHLLVAYIARAVGAQAPGIRLAASPREASAGIGRLRDLAEDIRAGRVRALAVSGAKAAAGIASLKEQGINVLFGNWHGLFAAPGLRPSQRDDLLARVKAATETPAWKALLAELGWTPVFQQGSDYARFIDEESRSLGYLADSMGLRRK